MATLHTVATIVSELLILIGAAIPIIIWVSRLVEGQRCQLRTAMLDTYYKCQETKQIRQYEAENFEKNYHAYKALKGNSFIDEIYEKAHEFEVIR